MKLTKLLSILAFIPALVSATESFTGDVIKITDGDTITVLTVSKKQIKIRFAGIDCPERGQPWGQNATDALKTVLAGKPITVEVLDKDRYGRTIARVHTGQINVNRELVEMGDCWVYPQYAKDERLFDLQDEAKAMRRGLWALPESEQLPPWEWRRK